MPLLSAEHVSNALLSAGHVSNALFSAGHVSKSNALVVCRACV